MKNLVVSKQKAAAAITIPSPWWWFLISGAPLPVIEEVAQTRLFPENFGHRGTLYIHASADYTWGLVQDDAEDLISALNWRRKPALWPSLFEMRKAAGRVVGVVSVVDGRRGRGFSLSLPSFLPSSVICADGSGLFDVSAGILAQLKTGAAA